MLAVTIINIIAILLTYLSRYKNFKHGFGVSILVLIVFFGIRYNYGNDYASYSSMFNEINNYQSIQAALDNTSIEVGWLLLNRLFKPVGFYILVFCLTCFQFGSFYVFLKRYIRREQLYIALSIYLFSSDLMLTMLSMMRQCLAMNIILWSIPLILNKKFVKSIILILLAAQFHQSAYIVFFFLLLVPFLQQINHKVYIICMLCLFIVLFVASNTVSELLVLIVDSNFEKYNTYVANGVAAELGSGLGFMFNVIIFCSLLFFDKQDNSAQSFFMKILAISYLFIPLGFVVQLIARVSVYFKFAGISGYLAMLHGKTGLTKIIGCVIVALFFLIMVYGYFSFFYDEIWHDAYYKYRTVLGAV